MEAIVDRHHSMTNETILADRNHLAQKTMRLHPGARTDHGVALNFDEWADETPVANAAAVEIIRLSEKGRPVLVGTTSVEVSELISRMLKMKNIHHNVLNAKQHQREAEIVAEDLIRMPLSRISSAGRFSILLY